MDLARLPELGIGGILVLLILKEVFGFLKNKNYSKRTDAPEESLAPNWFVSRSLERSITDLSRSVDKLAQSLEDMHEDIKETKSGMISIRESILSLSNELKSHY